MAETKKRGRPAGSKNKSTNKKSTTGTKKSGGKASAPKKQEKITVNLNETADQDALKRKIRKQNLVMAVLLIAVAVFITISILSDLCGWFGNGVSFVVMGAFGRMGFFLPVFCAIYALLLIFDKEGIRTGLKVIVLMFIMYVWLSAIYSIGMLGDVAAHTFGIKWLQTVLENGVAGQGGGVLGMSVALLLSKVIGIAGAYIVTLTCVVITVLLTMRKPFERIHNWMKKFRQEREEYLYSDYNDEDSDDIEVPEQAKSEGKAVKTEADKKGDQLTIDDIEEEALKERNKKKKILNYVEEGTGEQSSDDGRSATGLDGGDEVYSGFKPSHKKGRAGLFKGFGNHEPETPADPNAKRGLESESDGAVAETLKLFGASGGVQPKGKVSEKLTLDPEGATPTMYADLFEKVGGEGAKAAGTVAGAAAGADAMNSEPEAVFGEDEESVANEFSYDEAEAENTDGEEVVENEAAEVQKQNVRMDQTSLDREVRAMGRELAAGSAAAAAKKPEMVYEMPPISLLSEAQKTEIGNDSAALQKQAALLEETLASFNVQATVTHVARGPAVTRFEVQPGTGVKVRSIVRLQDDIALNLRARSLRIEAPVPGKSVVGIETENEEKSSVVLREVIDSHEFRESKSKITFAVGRDISGNPVIADLKSMPHLLIAGATGSGKSVCVNSIIISMLYKARPDEVKLILVDPKVVELSNYNGIPHLMIPVVNEASKAAVALNWAVKEMEERYRKFKENAVRDLGAYNRKADASDELERMPEIVIIIDELADLMMAAPQQVEDAICRLAQMARAAGMHLIVATQRPSVDVITGLIKANIPSRIALAVSSQVDSRTILDGSGAEKLVGNGDMLFNPLGASKPLRVQGTYVSDEEIERVIEYVSGQDLQESFSADLMDTIETSAVGYDDSGADELLEDAIELAVGMEQISVSMMQRRFRIGFNRAARIMDQMEERGIVGLSEGSKPRQVLMTAAELEAIRNRAEASGVEIPRADSEEVQSFSDEELMEEDDTQYVTDEYNSEGQAPDYEPDPEPEDI